MLYPLSYEGRRTKPLVRGKCATRWLVRSHLIILGRGLAAACRHGTSQRRRSREWDASASAGLVDRRHAELTS